MGLVYEVEGYVARAGLNCPEEKNALDPEILMDLHRAWLEINKDQKVRAVILYSCLPA